MIHIFTSLDAIVEQTRNGPLPPGAVSTFSPLLFAGNRSVYALMILLYSPEAPIRSFFFGLADVLGWACKPLASAMNFPQLVLGFRLVWGIGLGWASVDFDKLLRQLWVW